MVKNISGGRERPAVYYSTGVGVIKRQNLKRSSQIRRYVEEYDAKEIVLGFPAI